MGGAPLGTEKWGSARSCLSLGCGLLQGPKGDKGSRGDLVSVCPGDVGRREKDKREDSDPLPAFLPVGTARSEGEWAGGRAGGTLGSPPQLLMALGTLASHGVEGDKTLGLRSLGGEGVAGGEL